MWQKHESSYLDGVWKVDVEPPGYILQQHRRFDILMGVDDYLLAGVR
jgi:hypothetical protein